MLPLYWFPRPNALQLPLPCVQNSRYLDIHRLEGILIAIGFDKVKEKWKPNGKVAYWLYRKGVSAGDPTQYAKKSVVREGASRNNFCILL
jgi:25S rRNA (adenine2142-N1)-methyltransferase